MAIRIKAIEPDSSAEHAGILPGEKIVSINGHNISNFLDLQFYGADENLKLELLRLNGEKLFIDISDNWETPLGIMPEDHKCRECANKCIFCFIDQMPPQQRDTLYVKDDDYAFSFVFGNFLTLTNLTERDYKKIFEQRLYQRYHRLCILLVQRSPVLLKLRI